MEFRNEMLDKRVCDVFGELPIKSTFRAIINQKICDIFEELPTKTTFRQTIR